MTTMCPLLPGQPVNVLHVPIVLPDNRCYRRGSSASSEKWEDYRTMKPEDKYMNPRQPPKPKPILRLKTSPSLFNHPNPSWPFNGDIYSSEEFVHSRISQSSNATGRSKRRRRGFKTARSASPPRSRGLRAAFRYLNGNSPERGAVGRKGGGTMAHDDSTTRQMGTQQEGWRSMPHSTENVVFEMPVPEADSRDGNGHVLRWPVCGVEDRSVSIPIQDRRAATKSRDSSPEKKYLTLDRSPKSGLSGLKLETPTLPKQNPQISLAHAEQSTISKEETTPKPPDFKFKRLPTLPNSPSSVMEEALNAIEAQYRAIDMEALCSRFSSFTMTAKPDANEAPCQVSRFSEWSTDTEALSPDSMVSSSTLNNDKQTSPASVGMSQPATPRLTADSEFSSVSVSDDSKFSYLSLPRLSLTLSSPTLDLPWLSTNDVEFDRMETNPKRHAALFEAMESWAILDMPCSPDSSSTFVSPENSGQRNSSDMSRNITATRQSCEGSGKTPFPRQASMIQEMIDELGYLRSMIESGIDGF